LLMTLMAFQMLARLLMTLMAFQMLARLLMSLMVLMPFNLQTPRTRQRLWG